MFRAFVFMATTHSCPYTPPSKAALELQALVDAAPAWSTVAVQPGEYLFNSADLNMTGLLGVTLLAQGAVDLLFGLGYGIVIHSARHLVVTGNFSLDYTESPSSQGTITSVGAGCFSTSTPPQNCTLHVAIHAGFPPPDPAVRADLCYWPQCEAKIIVFDGATKNMRRPQMVNWFLDSHKLPTLPSSSSSSLSSSTSPMSSASPPPSSSVAAPSTQPPPSSSAPPPTHHQLHYRIVTKQMWAHNVRAGDVATVSSRQCGPCAYRVLNSTNVTTRGLAVHGSCNMAVWELGGGGGNVYDRVKVVRKPSVPARARPPAPTPPPTHSQAAVTATDAAATAVAAVTATAAISYAYDSSSKYLVSNFDGIHSEGTVVGPSITSCALEHIGDDFFNVQNAIDIVLGTAASAPPPTSPEPEFESETDQRGRGRGGPGSPPPTPIIDTVVVADKSFGSTYPVAPGTKIRFFAPSGGGRVWSSPEAFLWESRVLAADPVPPGGAPPGSPGAPAGGAARWLPRAANLSAAFEAEYGWGFAGFLSGGYQLWALRLDVGGRQTGQGHGQGHAQAVGGAGVPGRRGGIPAQVRYTTFAQVNSTWGARLAGNAFRDGASRVGPLLSPASACTGNVFDGAMLGGLLLSAETTWLSGNLGLSAVNVTGNVFRDCCAYTRVGYPHGQCNTSGAGAGAGATPFPVYNPAGSRGVLLDNNTIL